MNTHRLTTMVLAAALAGYVHTLVAEENTSTTAGNESPRQAATEQQQETELTVWETEAPQQVVAPPAENLLSNLKVYPSF